MVTVCPPLDPKNRFQDYHFTHRGATHGKNGTVCQDASDSFTTKYESMAVVCDGHGGADYFRSDRGSQLAAAAFRSCVEDKDFVRRLDKTDTYEAMDDLVRQLLKSVIFRWNTAVEADLLEHPLTEDELTGVSDKARDRYRAGERLPSIYGTTLLGFVCGRQWCFGVQIGDGKCVLANDWGQMYEPIPWDEACFLNVTTSLSDENAFDEFRFWVAHFTDKDFPVAVFLGTDGIDDSFAGKEKLHDFYRLVLWNLSGTATEEPITDLGGYLPTLSAQGSGDDVSVGILLNRGQATYEKKRWEGTGRRIFIDNYGDMDADSYERTYSHQTMIPVEVGRYDVRLGRSGQETVEILSVEEERVRLRFRGEEHILTIGDKLRLFLSDWQGTYDGPWHNAEDMTLFTLL